MTYGRTLLRLGCLFLSVVLVLGVFFFIFSAMSPKPGGTHSTAFAPGESGSIEDAILGFYLQLRQSDLQAPEGDDATPVQFKILPGQLPADVAVSLKDEGLIRDSDLFVKLAKYRHVGANIQAGDYILKRTMTMEDILETLQHGRAKAVDVVIRPGWRAEEIAEYLGTLGLSEINSGNFLQAIKNGNSVLNLVRDRPKTAPASLEGFIFPETYNVPLDVSTDSLLTLILGTLDQRITERMRQEAAAAKMSFYEVVTLASIVEREAVVPDERPIIASVYLNRLKYKQLLQADPTVQYAMGYQAATKQWWKTPVTLDEYQRVNSPYNTYLHAGLPPGPICNPSLASIVAVLEPAQTDYLFFLAKGDGSHVFAKTFEEHQQNMVKFGYSK